MNYELKYTGEQIDLLLQKISELNDYIDGDIELIAKKSDIDHGFVTMNAPASTTLTEVEYEELINGKVHLISGHFLTYNNLVLMPPSVESSVCRGIFVTLNNFGVYSIDKNSKSISLVNSNNQFMYLRSVYSLNGKVLPAFPPNDGTYVMKSINGTLTWVKEV